MTDADKTEPTKAEAAAKAKTAIGWLNDAGVDTTLMEKRLKALSDGHAPKVYKDAKGKVVRTVPAAAPSVAMVADVVDDCITPAAIAKLVDEVVQEFLADFAKREPVIYAPQTEAQAAESEVVYVKQE